MDKYEEALRTMRAGLDAAGNGMLAAMPTFPDFVAEADRLGLSTSEVEMVISVNVGISDLLIKVTALLSHRKYTDAEGN